MTTEPGVETSVEPFDWYFREVQIAQSYSAGPDDMRLALNLIQRGAVSPNDVVTSRVSLDELPEAYRKAAVPGEHLKTMVLPNSEKGVV